MKKDQDKERISSVGRVYERVKLHILCLLTRDNLRVYATWRAKSSMFSSFTLQKLNEDRRPLELLRVNNRLANIVES